MRISAWTILSTALALPIAANATPICGSLATATWSPAGNPYVVCTGGAVVPAGATLTIQPGVLVQFQSSAGNKLTVQGTLAAVGTTDQPITFTGQVASPGSWGGLSIDGAPTPAVATLRSVVVEYGGVSGSSGAAISVDRGTLTLAHGIVRSSAGSGLYATTRSTPTLGDTSFTGNALDAVRLADPVSDLPFTALAASGNGLDAIHVTGLNTTPRGERRWMAPGLPFVIDTLIINLNGDVLAIDPGNELRFGTNVGFQIGGRLDAVGTPTAPILMTAQSGAPGGWRGILVDGGARAAIAHLEEVTLEDAGGDIAGADLEVANGQVIASHDIVRNARLDGVLVDSNATVSIQNSQIVGNGRYGVDNGQPPRVILATNDWWGDPSGPQSDVAGCPSGTGQRVSAGVAFRPVLTDAAGAVPVALSAMPAVTMAPRRWFAPADGTTRVYVDVTVRDGNGAPLPGRTVRLASTLGTVTDGGVTDADGKTLAYLTANAPGDANLVASLDVATCEAALSPAARVTFTTPVTTADLFPASPAPYLGKGIEVSPLPVVAGVPTTISATLTNPLPAPITVDVSFGYVQASIGLAFGPIADLPGQVVPAGGTSTLSATFTPPISGHYCVEVDYAITAVGTAGGIEPLGGGAGSGRRQRNLNVYQPPTGSPSKGDGLKKTRKVLKGMETLSGQADRSGILTIQLWLVKHGIGWDLDNAEKISGALQGDPPRPDYKTVDEPVKLTLPPLVADADTPAAVATAVNELGDALADVNAAGTAAVTALDREGGASEAMDLEWAATQQAALLEYNRQMGEALATAATKIDAFLAAAAAAGATSAVVPRDQVIAYQASLATGFPAADVADAHAVGLTDADIEALRQQIVTANPDDLAGDLVARLQELRDRFVELGDALVHPAVFSPGAVVGSAGDAPGRVTNAEGLGNSLIHIYDTTATVTVGNPLGTTTAIDLRTRPISLPADWAIDVTPQQVMLAPGEQTTVTVTLLTGAPIAQGSVPRMAVEGWAGLTLLGGVTVDVVAPAYTTLTFPCASIDECYTALGATLPDPSAAPSKKARRTALKLQKRYKALGALLAKAAAASGKKRTRRYAKAGKVLQALDRAAQRADGKKTLAVPFAPIDAAVTALRARMTASPAPALTAGRRSHVTRRQDMHAVGDVRS